MKFKAFGLTWDLKPVLIVLWMFVGVALLGTALAGMLSESIVAAILGTIGSLLWVWINSTLEANGVFK